MTARLLPSLLVLAAAAAVLAAILALNHGVFTYSLDDPYIHLALSERLRLGHYGINPGEAAAPSSSVLWPLLLAPLAGTALHMWLPLGLNLACLLASVEMLRRLAARRLPPLPAALAAALLALSLNFVGLAFTGMEHGLQVALALAVLCGLLEFEGNGQVSPLLTAAIVLGPLVRFEAVAVSSMALLVLALSGRRRLAAGLGLATLLPLAAFAVFLVRLGLPPLPASVLTKLAAGQGAPFDLAVLLVVRWGAVLEALLLVALAASLTQAEGRRRWRLVLFAGGVGLAHLLAGRWGWSGFYRYEIYALTLSAAALVELYGDRLPGLPARRLAIGGLALVVLCHPLLAATQRTPLAANDVYLQQYQMHRFVTGYARSAVAVNDLGWISYGNPAPVLDLWGLASEDARQARAAAGPGWMAELVEAHRVPLAMIYADVFGAAVPASWIPLARLELGRAPVSAARGDVTVYATRSEAAAPLRQALSAFAPTLPAEARLVMPLP
ncbi:MAG TPA: hypothetical protein VK558_16490 [Patescibacteria group bacterium]|nr:hypothetical protein [Patescibacteria group bacterium]